VTGHGRRMRAEVFFVRRAGAVIAEPTGGTSRYVPCSDPQRWWAETAPGPYATDGDRPHLVEIETVQRFPDHGSIGRVVRPLGLVLGEPPRGSGRSSDADAVFDCLRRVPESWLPYEVRVHETPGTQIDAFVGTLLPVLPKELRNVLGPRWQDLVRVESWLRPE
jgi:hypothetical protein